MNHSPILVGILNVTPDSFSDGGASFATNDALKNAEKLLTDGATIIDVGAESTNPKSHILGAQEEQTRLSTVLSQLLASHPDKISLDTYHPETLNWALQYGSPILNDVSGLHQRAMQELVAEHGLTVVVGHLPQAAKGVPVAAHTVEPLDTFEQVRDELLERAHALEQFGIKKERIVLDPNIGFGKTMKLNWQLLEFAKFIPDYPVMIGHSRKRFLGCDPETGEWLPNGQELRFTDEINKKAARIAENTGAAYLRVHSPALYMSSSSH